MKYNFRIAAAALLAVSLMGCGRAEEPIPSETVPTMIIAPEQEATTIVPVQEAAVMAALPEPAVPVVLEAEPSGLLQECCEEAVIDYSHTEDGYVMACYTGQTEQRLKLRIRGPTGITYTYNLTPGQWTVFPLSDGDGNYQVTVYENVTGTKYATVMTASFSAALRDEFIPFLRPNQYVNFREDSETVARGLELTRGLNEPLQKVAAVYDFVVNTFEYDYEKAETVQSGYLPELDRVLEEGKGICFDYAALITAMLRSQEIPCKLVIGYAGITYHAWISVWTEESGWVDGAIFFDGQQWKRMDPTFDSTSGGSEEMMEFIQNGSYTEKYLY